MNEGALITLLKTISYNLTYYDIFSPFPIFFRESSFFFSLGMGNYASFPHLGERN